MRVPTIATIAALSGTWTLCTTATLRTRRDAVQAGDDDTDTSTSA